MPKASPSTTAPASPLARGVIGAFQLALRAALILVPTVFGHLHRFGGFPLLFLVSLLLAFWVVSGLMGVRLWHRRSWPNLVLWALLGLALAQVLPLPLPAGIDSDVPRAGASAGVVIESARDRPGFRHAAPPWGRYSTRPSASVGVLMLMTAAGGLYWLVGSAALGRKRVRRTTWAVGLGLAILAFWAIASCLVPGGRPDGRPQGLVLILGGDSLVPALLAALPLCLALAVRPLGWMPKRPVLDRVSRWRWLDRSPTIWGGIGLAMTGLVAAALGMSHVPRLLLAACAALAVGFVLVGHALGGPSRYEARRPGRAALALALWVVAAMAFGSALGRPVQPAASADEPLATLVASLSAERSAFGLGAGAVSSRAVFGTPGWPVTPGDDGDTSGFLVLRAEFGWVGLVLVLLGALGLAGMMLRSRRGGRGPWPKTAMMVGLGALAANLLYFRTDAVALLAPNLLALATVFGVVLAWAASGVEWRPQRARRMGGSHWPLVVGAIGLIGAVGLAENQMLDVAKAGPGFSDKVFHFGTFAVVSLLLCFALGPRPTSHYLKTRILLAVAVTAGLGAAMEFAQRYLTADRSFEGMDIVANLLGASLMGLLWWVVRRGQTSAPEAPSD